MAPIIVRASSFAAASLRRSLRAVSPTRAHAGARRRERARLEESGVIIIACSSFVLIRASLIPPGQSGRQFAWDKLYPPSQHLASHAVRPPAPDCCVAAGRRRAQEAQHVREADLRPDHRGGDHGSMGDRSVPSHATHNHTPRKPVPSGTGGTWKPGEVTRSSAARSVWGRHLGR